MRYVIVGNGVAGAQAAISIRQKDPSGSITLVSRERPYFFSRTALMYVAMGELRPEDTEPFERIRWDAWTITRELAEVSRIVSEESKVLLEDGRSLPFDRLLLATGSRPAFYGWPGQDLEGVSGFVSWQDLERSVEGIRRAAASSGRAVVVGGGLIGIELVEVCLRLGLQVDYLIREPWYWQPILAEEEGRYIEALLASHHVRVHLATELASLEGEAGRVKAVVTKRGEEIPCGFVGLATGVLPEIALAKASGVPTGRGILANWKLETHTPNVWTAGDCVEIETPGRNFTRAVWYSSRDMGRVAGANMAGEARTYDPGMWYNSAKFFDREYTTAGRVFPLEAGEEAYLHQDARHSVRVAHAKGRLLGFSLIGARWDHTRLLEWIREERTLDWFLDHHAEALFDPELFLVPTVRA